MQLDGYLRSLYAMCSGDFRVSVLAKVDPEYESAYYGPGFPPSIPAVTIRAESDFASDLNSLIGDAEFTCFGCDDAVFVAPFGVDEIAVTLENEDLIGLSLRLGSNVTRDMFGAPLQQPYKMDGRVKFAWNIHDGVGDWAYPWEVLGTVYRTDFVKEMVAAINPPSPSQLEERGSRCWSQHTTLRHMAAYQTSRLVVPTVNLVQNEFPNGIKGSKPLSPEFLLECWNQGLRLDTERYAGMAPESWRVGEFYLKRCLS